MRIEAEYDVHVTCIEAFRWLFQEESKLVNYSWL